MNARIGLDYPKY